MITVNSANKRCTLLYDAYSQGGEWVHVKR